MGITDGARQAWNRRIAASRPGLDGANLQAAADALYLLTNTELAGLQSAGRGAAAAG
jgi:hypothetical protein